MRERERACTHEQGEGRGRARETSRLLAEQGARLRLQLDPRTLRS